MNKDQIRFFPFIFLLVAFHFSIQSIAVSISCPDRKSPISLKDLAQKKPLPENGYYLKEFRMFQLVGIAKVLSVKNISETVNGKKRQYVKNMELQFSEVFLGPKQFKKSKKVFVTRRPSTFGGYLASIPSLPDGTKEVLVALDAKYNRVSSEYLAYPSICFFQLFERIDGEKVISTYGAAKIKPVAISDIRKQFEKLNVVRNSKKPEQKPKSICFDQNGAADLNASHLSGITGKEKWKAILKDEVVAIDMEIVEGSERYPFSEKVISQHRKSEHFGHIDIELSTKVKADPMISILGVPDIKAGKLVASKETGWTCLKKFSMSDLKFEKYEDKRQLLHSMGSGFELKECAVEQIVYESNGKKTIVERSYQPRAYKHLYNYKVSGKKIESTEEGGEPDVIFASDLNRDGQLDFVFGHIFGISGSAGEAYSIYLSKDKGYENVCSHQFMGHY